MADTFKKKDMGDHAPDAWEDHIVVQSTTQKFDKEVTYNMLKNEKEMLETSIKDSEDRIKVIETEMAAVESKAK